VNVPARRRRCRVSAAGWPRRPQAAGSRRAAPTSKAAVGRARSGRGRSRAPPGRSTIQAKPRRCRARGGREQHDEQPIASGPSTTWSRRARAARAGWPRRRTLPTSPTARPAPRPATARRRAGDGGCGPRRHGTPAGADQPAREREHAVRERHAAPRAEATASAPRCLCGSRAADSAESVSPRTGCRCRHEHRAGGGSRTGTAGTRRADGGDEHHVEVAVSACLVHSAPHAIATMPAASPSSRRSGLMAFVSTITHSTVSGTLHGRWPAARRRDS